MLWPYSKRDLQAKRRADLGRVGVGNGDQGLIYAGPWFWYKYFADIIFFSKPELLKQVLAWTQLKCPILGYFILYGVNNTAVLC